MGKTKLWDSPDDGTGRTFRIGLKSGTLEERPQGHLVSSGYSEFMSYLPRNNNEIAIPTWELSDRQLEMLEKSYIIAKDVCPADMKQAIKDLMYPVVELVLQGKGKGFVFKFPNNDNAEIDYNSDLCFPLLKRGKEVKRNFHHDKCTHSATMTTWTLKVIFENLESGTIITLRDLFYRRSKLFEKQRQSDDIVTDICFLFGCTRRSLYITSEDKGWVCGAMTVQFQNGKIMDCSLKTHIPDVSRIKSCKFGESLKYILVIEKGTIFNYLERLGFHETENCIIMTSNGVPDISARRFLKWLQRETRLPIMGVADADPAGLQIMKYYSQGSVNLAPENFNMAVPSLMWVGLSLLDIERLGIQLDEYNSKDLNETDITTLDSLLDDKYMKLTPRWRCAAEKMRSVAKKTSFEILHEKGQRYVADFFLPQLINRALGIESQATAA